MSRIGRFTETEHSLEVTSGWKEGEMERCCLMVTQVPFGVMKNVWKQTIAGVAQ